MSQIRITPEQMRSRAGEVHTERDTYQQVIRNMEGIIANLQTEWEGAASRGYEAQFNNLRPSFEAMRELFEALGQQLKDTARELEDLDQRIASKFN